ncbi:Alpha/beta hydrolase family-domain-containing protein [Mycena epipterygia]|nr:Alpha/beta hydrolase family-domain-containing protein [Mycena epipterygia]
MTAKRYCTSESASNDKGFSLIFAHCIGSRTFIAVSCPISRLMPVTDKEQWEPTIERIFRSQQSKPRHQRVREAWAFDWQNHGDAAILNRELVASTRQMGVSAYEWAEAIAAFVRSPRMHGTRIVAIGHSAGTGAIVMSLKGIPVSALPYVSVLLIEPTIATPEMFYNHIEPIMPTIIAATTMRRDCWRSGADAYEWLKRRAPWKKWDPRVLRMLTEHGLAATPDGQVALKCDRRQEAASYPDVDPHFDAAHEIARVACAVPVHIVWANHSELVPKIVQDSLCDVSEGGRFASITRLDGGHFILQEDPDRIALAICSALDGVGVDLVPRGPTRSRL